MVDFSMRASVLDTVRLAAGPHAAARLELVPSAAQFIFRGNHAASRAASHAFGVAFPVHACRAAQDGARAVLWLGPDEWLLLAPAAQAIAVQAAIAATVGEMPHSLVAVSHRNAALHISGPEAATVLNAGCPLDLHKAEFPPGMCTRTLLAKAPIILWRTALPLFYMSTWRSFMPYAWDFLIEARTRL